MSTSVNVIKDGSKVIIRRGSFLRPEVVRRKRRVETQKLHFFLDNAIGCEFGKTFEVKDKNLYIKTPCETTDQSKPATTSGENNQFINDDRTSQKMSTDDIMALKADGITGEKIIDRLIENSDTFDKKTEFSQEKYLKKKKKKHISEITILKPTLPLTCDMLYSNAPGKILELRKDTVSQILTRANIQSNINVMVLESSQSFLVGVILHRMGGLGNLIQFYNGDFPVRLCLPHFDLAENELDILHGFPINKVNTITDINNSEASNNTIEMFETPISECESMAETNLEKTVDTSECDTSECANDDNNKVQDKEEKTKYRPPKALTDQEKATRKKKRDDEEEKALSVLKKCSMDSLIIATKFHAKPTLLRLLEFLAPSRPFVVFSPYKEVLVECYLALKELQNTVLLNLTETWWRNYQVLSKRTHPHIMTDGTGGYLLTGIKIDVEKPVESTTTVVHNTSDAATTESPAKKLKTT